MLADEYHDLLTPEIAEETHAHIESALTRRGLVFGGRPLSTVLRPRLMTPDALASLQRRILPLQRAFGKAYAMAISDASFRSQFGLLDWEETLLTDAPGYANPSPTSRLDFFYVPANGGLALTEYNAETPAGAAYNDALSDVFLDTPALRAFSRRYEIMALPSRAGVIGAMLAAYREWSGSRDKPRIAILDWDDVPTATEFVLYADHLRSLGFAVVIDDPRRAEYKDGKLWVQGAPADLIYKRVLISELIETCGMGSDMVRAVRERAVCMVDGFRCKILHKKASLAVLSDEANATILSAEELDAVHQCIPWTRVVRERMTRYGDQTVDLLRFMLDNRERLVLKPNDDYGGKGITLGWTVDDTAWERAIQAALVSPYIVQERVEIPSEPYASWIDGQVQVIDRMFDTAPFITQTDYMEGILTRLSTAALLNVTAGGGSTVPTFIVQRRDA